tara:strand:+ start:310 stop:918 length:609 start_codon:yes stop_codon:yes gene_type:complete
MVLNISNSKKSFLLFCSLAIIGLGTPHVSFADDKMTIEESYSVLDKERIPFDREYTTIPAEEVQYLEHLFFITDLAFRERMEMMRHFHFKKSDLYIDSYLNNIDEFIASFDKKPAPTNHLRKVEIDVISALRNHKNFFIKWHNAKGTSAYSRLQETYHQDHYVQKSHKQLLDAYLMLSTLYPDETEHNRQAFYQHLCALDFI